MPSSDDLTSADHTPVINSAGTNVPSLVPSPIATNEPNERLQEAMCDALRKLENLQTNCKNEIIDVVAKCEHQVLSRLSAKESSSSKQDDRMKRSDSQIRQLQEENATLLLQLKTERSNSALVQAQNDDNTKHLKGVLEESRNELRKMIASTKSEIDYLSEIITHKNDEILKLQKSNADLTEKLDKVQTELIHFKSRAYEHTQDVQHNVTKSDEPKSQNNQHDLPQVLLIGTSNIDGINEGRLTTAANVTKIIAYRFNDTTKAIRSYTNTPNLVVLHWA